VPGECAGVRPASLGLQIHLARFWRPAMVRRRKGDFMQETPPPARFKTDMPQIPGVGSSSATPAAWPGKAALLSAGLGAVLVLLGGIVWWTVHSMGHPAGRTSEVAETLPAEPVDVSPVAVPASGPVKAATVEELAKPWSSREFTFVDPITQSAVPAIVVHLPGGAANSSASYWAFSLQAPFQSCHLEYVTDLSELTTRFGFHAAHPMVASACDGTIFDPLRMGTIASGAWVRGEIVQGAGLRPPIAIEIKVEGNNLVADRIE
jgi:hypothetical protein